MEFKWSERHYDLKTFVNKHSKNLPIIVRVTEGFCGLDDKDDYTYAADDEYRLTHLNKQPRVIVKDEIGRHISLPINRNLRFCKLYRDETKARPLLLSKMVETLDEGDRLICDNDEQVDFWLSGDKKMATKLGVLTFVAEYQERFLVGNTICEESLISEAIVIPAYASIRIALAEGLKGKSAQEFDDLRQQFAMESLNFKNHMANGNLEVMLFEGKVTDYKDYDYIKPSNFLRADAAAAAPITPPDMPRSPPPPPPSKTPGNIATRTSDSTGTQSTASHVPKPTPRINRSESDKPPESKKVPPPVKPRGPHQIGPPPTRPPPEIPEKSGFVGRKPFASVGDLPPLPPRNTLPKPPVQVKNPTVEYQNKVSVVTPIVPKQPVIIDQNADYELTDQDQTATDSEDDVVDDGGMYEEINIDDVFPPSTPKAGFHNKSIKKMTGKGSRPTQSEHLSHSTSGYNEEDPPVKVVNDHKQAAEIQRSVSGGEMLSANQEKVEERLGLFKQKSVEEVCELLDLLNLSRFKESFRENGIDGDLLTELTVSDMISDLGFSRIQAKKLYKNMTEDWLPK